MIALKISDVKAFTSHLFVQQTFDHFLVSEATITTYNTFQIDGYLNREFYEGEDALALPHQYSTWEQLRPLCFSLIKGKHLPLSFKFIFRLTDSQQEQLIHKSGEKQPNTIDAFFLHVLYKNNNITCITGSSARQFTLDKTPDQAWDQAIKEFLNEIALAWEIV